MRSKVILAGGSGLLGRAVAQDLVKMGWDVVDPEMDAVASLANTQSDKIGTRA